MSLNSYEAAALGLVDCAAVNSPAFREREMRVSREGSDPDIIRFSRAFTKQLKQRGMPFFPHCFYRGREAQNALHAKGNSKARFGSSPHNFGMAVDIVHFGRYWNLSEKEWAIVGLMGKEAARKLNLKVSWGGDWKFYDPAHWELSDWKVRSVGLPSDMPLRNSTDFASTFSAARRAGLSTFTWQGRLYSTDLA